MTASHFRCLQLTQQCTLAPQYTMQDALPVGGAASAPPRRFAEVLDSGRFVEVREPGCLALLCGGGLGAAQPQPWSAAVRSLPDTDHSAALAGVADWAVVVGTFAQVRGRAELCHGCEAASAPGGRLLRLPAVP